MHGGGLLQHDRHHHQPLPARLHRGVQVQLCFNVTMYWIGVVNPIMTNGFYLKVLPRVPRHQPHGARQEEEAPALPTAIHDRST